MVEFLRPRIRPSLVAMVALLGTGCIPSSFVRRDTSLLRNRDGVCAGDRPKIGTTVKACFSRGSPGTVHDDPNISWLSLTFNSRSRVLAKPDSWYVIVSRNGAPLIEKTLEDWRYDVGACDQYGCDKYGVEVLRWTHGWAPGAYDIRVIATFDTSIVASMRIELTGQAIPAAEIPLVEQPPPRPEADQAADGNGEWLVTVGDKEVKVSLTVLKILIKSGEVKPDTQVKNTEDDVGWIRAIEHPDVAAVFLGGE